MDVVKPDALCSQIGHQFFNDRPILFKFFFSTGDPFLVILDFHFDSGGDEIEDVRRSNNSHLDDGQVVIATNEFGDMEPTDLQNLPPFQLFVDFQFLMVQFLEVESFDCRPFIRGNHVSVETCAKSSTIVIVFDFAHRLALSTADSFGVSMEGLAQYKHFSAEVRIQLRAEGSVYDVAAAGPRDIILREPADLPPCDAEVVMFVDGKGHSLPVRLRNGAMPWEKKIRITHRGEMQRLDSTADDGR